MEIESNQGKLMEMVVDKVLKKHNVKVEQNNLTKEEKDEIKKVVENIKKDVERFLKNQTKKKTEKDFQNESTYIPASLKEKKQIFTQPNNTKSVKTFIRKKNK